MQLAHGRYFEDDPLALAYSAIIPFFVKVEDLLLPRRKQFFELTQSVEIKGMNQMKEPKTYCPEFPTPNISVVTLHANRRPSVSFWNDNGNIVVCSKVPFCAAQTMVDLVIYGHRTRPCNMCRANEKVSLVIEPLMDAYPNLKKVECRVCMIPTLNPCFGLTIKSE